MKFVKLFISFVLIFVCGYCANYLYEFTYGYYTNEPVTTGFLAEFFSEYFVEYNHQLYFFMWIGYALAGAFALIALYCVYYFLSMLYAIIRGYKY